MKRFLLLFAVATIALSAALPTSAQVRLGVKAGVCVNSIHGDLFDGDNRTGFAGGFMLDGRIPLLGFAFDGSLMYVRRSPREHDHADFLSIPINLKYRFGIPVISHVVTPFLTTGPEWSYMIDHNKLDVDIKKSGFSWNFGFGVELLSHVQVAASYGLGLTNSYEQGHQDSKNRYWTVTAAYLF